jgi:hypothetical protein
MTIPSNTFTAVLATAFLVIFAPTALAADDPNGFVRNRVSLSQTVPQLAAGKFVVEIKCAQACKTVTRLGISPEDATELGFKNVNPRSWFEIGRVARTLSAGVWTKVQVPLTAEARLRVVKTETGLRIAGQVAAASTTTGRHGWASWFRTCRLPTA